MKFADNPYTQRILIKKPAKKLKYLCFFGFFFISLFSSQTVALADSQSSSANSPISASQTEKKEIKSGKFVFDIKDNKLSLDAKEADIRKSLKVVYLNSYWE